MFNTACDFVVDVLFKVVNCTQSVLFDACKCKRLGLGHARTVYYKFIHILSYFYTFVPPRAVAKRDDDDDCITGLC